MSPLRRGSATVTGVSVEALDEASQALRAAVDTGGGQLPEAPRERAGLVVDKVRQRTALVGGHTVVALAGATGSGKSSLFNALVGADVAEVGHRRPTTSRPTAGHWGEEPVGELLDWLGIGQRHAVGSGGPSGAGAVGSLDGLVLLDLPDFDSRESANRVEAERVLDLVDVFVWVTDPQKYADARLHDDYVRALATHDAVTLVVLNQADLLTEAQLAECVADLSRLTAADGMATAPVLTTSVVTGQGLDVLRQRLANAVVGAGAARSRLAADVRAAAGALRPGVADTEPTLAAESETQLVSALARTAGVPTVVDAVNRDHRMAAVSHTGWPFTRWVQGLRPRPLRRLRLDGDEVRITQSDVRSVLGRSSLPPPTPAARAAVSLATRQVADRAATGLPIAWADAVADAVADAASPPGSELGDVLDQAVLRTPLRGRDPAWWRVVGMAQVALAVAALAGLAWLVVLMVLGWLQLPQPDTLRWGPLPAPFVLLAGGVLGGLLLAALSRWWGRVGGRRRARAVEKRLHAAVAEVADAQVVAPVAEVLGRHRTTREHLERAAAV
ncbi:MAG TPA: GTPase [Dermatophilaceae bacterium]|nr:GTPase [Dermatophilaceae bacterium]